MRTESDVQETILQNDWVIGAVNFDEDLHFSAYYLRASTPEQTRSLYPGYSTILAFYEEFVERYYLLRSECLSNAEAIVRRAISDSSWLPGVIAAVVKMCDELGRVFPKEMSASSIRSASDAALRDIYRQHHSKHSEMYRWARLPEALDRGVNHFTGYLHKVLGDRGLGPDESASVFFDLTAPVEPSILLDEVLSFERIAAEAGSCGRNSSLLLSYPRKARLLISPEVCEMLEEHVERWKYLDYHGYGVRELRTLSQTVERLVHNLERGSAVAEESELLGRFSAAEQRREHLFDEIGLDVAHRSLFEVYPKVGALKLYRRYAQLRNFYYLDLVITEVARRLSVDEWTVRCLLPDEVLTSLDHGRVVAEDVAKRRYACMYSNCDSVERVWTGDAVRSWRRQLDERSRADRDHRVLKGVVASQGRVRGTCKIVVRANDAREQFPDGTILVSESTDPDLLKLLRVAGGVLTQQGGVTAHAAIICRELGVPAIIGIPGLLESVRDGDVLEVDAFSGTVKRLGDYQEPPPAAVVELSIGAGSGETGNKAYNLWRTSKLGFTVPSFVVLRAEAVVRLLNESVPTSREHLAEWMRRRLRMKPKESGRLALRSSAIDEDRSARSSAGRYESILDVSWERLWSELRRFVRTNGTEYRGGIIVQRMVEGSIGGVCLTDGLGTQYRNSIVVEFSMGTAAAVTAGDGLPGRLVVERGTGDVTLDTSGGIKGIDDESEIVRRIICDALPKFVELETHFGGAVDVEWVMEENSLFILQVRPITVMS